jgi:hypothetical protein
MSYIIAFIKYADAKKSYPVQCFRTDIIINDQVIVRRSDGKLKHAIVKELRYLNWDCNGRIECKMPEAGEDKKGNIILPKGSSRIVGIVTSDAFIKKLRSMGWIPLKPKHKMYRAILAKKNCNHTAYIRVRKNGVDIQLFPSENEYSPVPYSLYEHGASDGRVVRHALAHTTFNLYEGILRFSNSFIHEEQNLDKYFVPVGSTDKRTIELKEKSEAERRAREESERLVNIEEQDDFDLYDVCSDGSGEPAYLGDGLWVTSDGRSHDWGR